MTKKIREKQNFQYPDKVKTDLAVTPKFLEIMSIPPELSK